MNNQKEIKLSSNWTNTALYIGTILSLLMIPILYFVTKDQAFHGGLVFGGLILLALMGFIIYLFVFICDARISGDKLILKKKFREKKEYTFDKIGYPKSFQIKRTKYTYVKMENIDGSKENYLIMNSKSLLSFENKDAEEILLNLRNFGTEK